MEDVEAIVRHTLNGRAGIEALCEWQYAPDDQVIHGSKLATITLADLRDLLAEADGLRIGWWNWMKAQGATDAHAIEVLTRHMKRDAPSATYLLSQTSASPSSLRG